jgi:hypothetical protein
MNANLRLFKACDVPNPLQALLQPLNCSSARGASAKRKHKMQIVAHKRTAAHESRRPRSLKLMQGVAPVGDALFLAGMALAHCFLKAPSGNLGRTSQ